MANVSQSIPNYLNGISQQADYDMPPGYLRDAVNVFPDITYGLRKRPGLRYEFYLGAETDYPNAYWFSLVQTDSQPCVGCIVPSDGSIHIWNLITRTKLTSTDSTAYLSINDKSPQVLNRNSYAAVSINNVTVICNRNARVAQSSDVTPGTLTGRVTVYADLSTLTPTEGDIYEITNTPNVDEDDFYVQYTNGAWEECAEPGIPAGVDDSTMPHAVLVDTTAGTFQFIEVQSNSRSAGDETSNPNPSFVGAFIHNAFFYLNRYGFLASDNVFLSRSLSVQNTVADQLQNVDYYSVSTLVQSAADPIDVNVASVKPTTLISVLPTVQGLTIFGTNEQFILYSEQGFLSPQTAIVKSISTFEMSEIVPAVQMGDESYFISKTVRNVRVFQFITQGIDRQPILNDVGKIITDYIPSNVDFLASNSQNQFISLSSSVDNKMYMYRTYKENNEIKFASWFVWELVGNVQLGAYFDDRFFATIAANGSIVVGSAALNLVPEEDLLGNVPVPDYGFPGGAQEGIGPFLDLWISNGTTEQISVAPTSTDFDSDGTEYWVDPIVTFPANYPSNIPGMVPCVVKTQDALVVPFSIIDRGVEGVGYTTTPTVNADGTWTISGRFNSSAAYNVNNWVAGWRFNYNLLFPKTFFVTQTGADWDAYTVIDRYKFIFNEVSDLIFQIRRLGSPRWLDARSITPAGFYQDNTTPSIREFTVELPVHQRNKTFELRMLSDSPFPVTLSKMMWEGQYQPKYYRRT